MSKVEQKKKVEVATLTDLQVGIGKRVKVADTEIALFKLKSGKVSAIENSCPHKGGPLSEGIVSGDHVFCPLHDWKICTTDGQVQAPDVGCVKKYDVEMVDEKVYIYVD